MCRYMNLLYMHRYICTYRICNIYQMYRYVHTLYIHIHNMFIYVYIHIHIVQGRHVYINATII